MNNMEILRLLSEEVFDFETGLTSSKAAYLKQEFCEQFQAVNALCLEILVSALASQVVERLSLFLLQQSADSVDLVYKTLRTLHGFLSWVPIGFIFENNLIELITGRVSAFYRF